MEVSSYRAILARTVALVLLTLCTTVNAQEGSSSVELPALSTQLLAPRIDTAACDSQPGLEQEVYETEVSQVGYEPVVEVAYCQDGCCGCYDECCGSDCCCDPCCGDCAQGCCCPCGPTCFVFGEALFLRATGNDVAHAQQQDGLGGAGTVPFGDIGVVDHDFNTGARVGFGCCLDACSGLVASYAFFETDGYNEIVPPTVPSSGGAVGSLVHHPGAVITASVGPVSATQDISFQVGDLMYRHALLQNACSEVNYLLGCQYGNLDQEFSQTGVFSGGSAGTLDTASSVTFDGGGLKAGIDGKRTIGRGISVHSRLTAAVMSGQFQSRYSMVNSTTVVQLAQANWKEDRVVSQVEYEIGLGWTSCTGRCHARLGYMFSHWGNMVTMPTFIDAVQADNYTDVSDTITFDGAVARFECNW